MRSYLATLQREILLVGCVSREHTVHHDVVLAGSYQSMAFDKHQVTRGICLFRQETLLASEKARTTRYQSAYECGMFVVGLGRKHERLLSGFGHDLDFSTIGGYSRCVATEYLGLVNDLKLAAAQGMRRGVVLRLSTTGHAAKRSGFGKPRPSRKGHRDWQRDISCFHTPHKAVGQPPLPVLLLLSAAMMYGSAELPVVGTHPRVSGCGWGGGGAMGTAVGISRK